MTRYLQLLMTMYFSVVTQSLQNGEGVCNKTEIQTELQTIQEEVIVGTTVVPCIIRSFLDQLSCSNRPTKTENVTESITKTVEVSRPVTAWFCCDGYVLVDEQCILKTTVGTTQEDTTQTTKARQTTEETTRVKEDFTSETNVVSTHMTQQDTTTQMRTTTEKTTHADVDSTTETNGVATQAKTQRYHTTPVETNILATETDIKTTEDIFSSGDVAFTITSGVHTVDTGFDDAKVTKDKTFVGVQVSSEATVISDDPDLRDILLYVFAVCALLFFVTMVLVIFFFHRRSRKTKKRSEIHTTLAMDDIIQNGNRITRIQSGDYCTEINENATNAYTELNMCGESTYEELKDEDPYEELPDCDDYDDCDASPRLQKQRDQKMKVFTK